MEELLQKETKTNSGKRIAQQCFHCGESCDKSISSDDKFFCCDGCKFVYQLIEENGLCNYYELSEKPGINVRGKFHSDRFAYLENEEIKRKLLRFDDVHQQHVHFYLPQMHCASCIWLLENLHTIDTGILFSKTNFRRKEIFIAFDPGKIALRKVVELLSFIGYEPYISFQEGEKKQAKKINRKRLFKIGVAGFCFSNIMMLSFPEYFSSGNIAETELEKLFSYLNLALSLPVFFYSANDFFISAWKGIRQKWLNIDAPIALAILVTFSRSVYEILSGSGPGYFDSMSGIVFFMLVGRWFQDKTYDSFSFDRNYKSYFPLGVTILNNDVEETTTIGDLKKGSRILVRQQEIVPADAIILQGEGSIDYSFVSGENNPLIKRKGELVYAGGRQLGGSMIMEVVNPVDQSYITQLWNNDAFTQQKNKDKSFIHPWSRYFTVALFIIAGSAAFYWWLSDPSRIWPAVTATLIVACPCSLLLSATFTYGNMLRHFGKNKLYLKNASVIESLSGVNTIVFDKTGTLTHSSAANVKYEGDVLADQDINLVYTIAKESLHPLSRIIKQDLLDRYPVQPMTALHFKEMPGLGIEGIINEGHIKIGSRNFIEGNTLPEPSPNSGEVYVSINGSKKGVFKISNQYRSGIQEMIHKLLNRGMKLNVISGDNEAEKRNLLLLFNRDANILFRQTPQEKLDFVHQLKDGNKKSKILMIGDGLNDAGALKESDVGIAVSENTSQFTPACDAIISSSEVRKLSNFLDYARSGKKIILYSFILSIAYNLVGLSFATQGILSPLIAAILMPASSISIVLFVTLATNWYSRKFGL